MPKPRKTKSKLETFVTGYSGTKLLGALEQFENSLAWEVFKSYAANVQRQYEVSALDLAGKEERGASYASGYAKCAEDMTNDFMTGLKNTVQNVNPVIENVRPEEDVEA